MIARVCDAIAGSGHLPTSPLDDYHAARKVMAALRRRHPSSRLSGVREALNRYRVSSWLADDNRRIELKLAGEIVLTIGDPA